MSDEHGFYHPNFGYWQAIAEPTDAVLASYPGGTVSYPLKPGENYEMKDGGWIAVAAPTLPYRIAKTTPWLRMTPDEASIMDGVMTQTDAQMRQIYMAAQYLSSDDQFWQTLRQLIADNLPGGSARADELLAPEG